MPETTNSDTKEMRDIISELDVFASSTMNAFREKIDQERRTNFLPNSSDQIYVLNIQTILKEGMMALLLSDFQEPDGFKIQTAALLRTLLIEDEIIMGRMSIHYGSVGSHQFVNLLTAEVGKKNPYGCFLLPYVKLETRCFTEELLNLLPVRSIDEIIAVITDDRGIDEDIARWMTSALYLLKADESRTELCESYLRMSASNNNLCALYKLGVYYYKSVAKDEDGSDQDDSSSEHDSNDEEDSSAEEASSVSGGENVSVGGIVSDEEIRDEESSSDEKSSSDNNDVMKTKRRKVEADASDHSDGDDRVDDVNDHGKDANSLEKGSSKKIVENKEQLSEHVQNQFSKATAALESYIKKSPFHGNYWRHAEVLLEKMRKSK